MLLLPALSLSQHARRHPSHNREGRNVSSDHGAGAYDCALTDGHAGKQGRIRTDVSPSAYSHWTDTEVSLRDRNVRRLSAVDRPEDLSTGPPTDVIFENKIASIEVALGTNPNMVAYDKPPIEPALQVRLRPNEHTAADLKRLQMLKPNAGSD
jgi:hypothetical protein